MKLFKLMMYYFGLYEDIMIDFIRFDVSLLYLIVGDIGSGKMIIFDVMCVVLYGNVFNECWLVEMFCFDFVIFKQVIEVIFLFEYKGVIY